MDNSFTRIQLRGEITDVKEQIKEMQTSMTKLNKKNELLDLKIEAYHNKLNTKIDKNQKIMVECIQEVLTVVGEINTTLVTRVDRIEKHLKLSDG